ncbi:MAG TPA: ATP-grasp domain-containing protein [Acidobacteriota bacterium]|jgi:D-alanine-D-alanine ligase
MKSKRKQKFRVVVLVRKGLVPPDSIEGLTPEEIQPWRTEWDVISTLRSMGHEVMPIGLYSDLGVIRTALEEAKPHVAFNVLEEFHGDALYDQHVVSFLELVRQPYTGCNPRGLTLAHDKALTKQILAYHRISVPGFVVFPLNRRVRRPKKLKFPLLVKSLIEEGSTGISQASIVHDDEKLVERVEFIHRRIGTSAIAEQYIEGREIYVAVMGNQRLQTFTPWELVISNLPEGSCNIATGRIKWNRAYQQRVGVITQAAKLGPELRRKIEHTSKRVYRLLSLSGYARIDYRVTEDGKLYLLEANPNPDIAAEEDFAAAAAHSGIKYKRLLERIINLGLRYAAW